MDAQKFKRKGELLAYATKHPGALSAHFLASIYARLSKGRVTRSSQLRETNVSQWAAQHSGLSEIRDIREVLTIAEAMDCINRKEIARAMDVLAQRILAVQQAKKKGGSWEKNRNYRIHPIGHGFGQQCNAGPYQLASRLSKSLWSWKQLNGAPTSGVNYACMLFSSVEKILARRSGNSPYSRSFGPLRAECLEAMVFGASFCLVHAETSFHTSDCSLTVESYFRLFWAIAGMCFPATALGFVSLSRVW